MNRIGNSARHLESRPPDRYPTLETTNGTTKLNPTRIQVTTVALPVAMTAVWFTADSTRPTNRATGSAVRTVTPRANNRSA